jgi:predicted ester cyclase
MNIKDFAGKYIKAEYEAFHEGKCDALEEVEDPNITYHFLAMNQDMTGFEAHKLQILAMRQAAPGLRINLKYLTGDGNVFSAHFTTGGSKFTETVPGLPPPTGKEIVASTLFVYRLDKGKIVEAWSNGTITGLT